MSLTAKFFSSPSAELWKGRKIEKYVLVSRTVAVLGKRDRTLAIDEVDLKRPWTLTNRL